MPIITLVSRGQKFEADRQAVDKSTYLRNLLRNLNPERVPEIPVNNVSPDILKMVLEWCEHYKDVPEAEHDTHYDVDSAGRTIEGSLTDESDVAETDRLAPVSPWDRKFLNVDAETLQSVILAANFLDIKPLLDAACKLVAELLRGRSPEEIVNAFNVVQVGL